MNVFAADSHSNGFGSKPGSLTGSTGLFRQIAVQPCLYVFAGRIFPPACEIRNDTLETDTVFFHIFVGCTIHQNLYEFLRYLAEGHRLVDACIFAESFDEPVVEDVHSLAALAPCIDSAVFQRDALVGYDQVRVEFENRSQSVAACAGAIWAVETK